MDDYVAKLKAFEAAPHPKADREACAWSDYSAFVLAERFVREMGLWPLYQKFLDRCAAEELADGLLTDVLRNHPDPYEAAVSRLTDDEVLSYFPLGELDSLFEDGWTVDDARYQLECDLEAGDKELRPGHQARD